LTNKSVALHAIQEKHSTDIAKKMFEAIGMIFYHYLKQNIFLVFYH